MVCTRDLQHLAMQAGEFVPQGSPCLQHGADHRREHGMPVSKLADTRIKTPAADLADLETKATQDAANAELDVEQLGLQQLAPDQQGAHLLGADRFGMYRPIPAH